MDSITDAIRYTIKFSDERYVEGVRDALDDLAGKGFTRIRRLSYWGSPFTGGITTVWRDPKNDQLFEVQFHTPWSFHARHEVIVEAYERYRNPNVSQPELEHIVEVIRGISSTVRTPPHGVLGLAPGFVWTKPLGQRTYYAVTSLTYPDPERPMTVLRRSHFGSEGGGWDQDYRVGDGWTVSTLFRSYEFGNLDHTFTEITRERAHALNDSAEATS